MSKTIYVDMDGVLADFKTEYIKYSNYLKISGEATWDKKVFRKSVLEHKIFTKLSFETNAIELIFFLQAFSAKPGVKVEILSSMGSHDKIQSEEAKLQKQKWLDSRGILWGRNFVHHGPKKADYAHEKALLIDDLHENCTAFNLAGGKSVLYTPDVIHSTIKEVEDFYKT